MTLLFNQPLSSFNLNGSNNRSCYVNKTTHVDISSRKQIALFILLRDFALEFLMVFFLSFDIVLTQLFLSAQKVVISQQLGKQKTTKPWERDSKKSCSKQSKSHAIKPANQTSSFTDDSSLYMYKIVWNIIYWPAHFCTFLRKSFMC